MQLDIIHYIHDVNTQFLLVQNTSRDIHQFVMLVPVLLAVQHNLEISCNITVQHNNCYVVRNMTLVNRSCLSAYSSSALLQSFDNCFKRFMKFSFVSFYLSWIILVDFNHVYNKTNNCWSFVQQFKQFSPWDGQRPNKSYVALGSASWNITFLWPSSTFGETIWTVAPKTSSYLYRNYYLN